MRYTLFDGLRLSRVGLGTAQFGLNYGLNNHSGQVQMRDIIKILEQAREDGVNFLDTARVYGSSEENLGKALHEIGAKDHFIICTKLGLPGNYRSLTETELLKATADSLETSINTLGLEQIPFYLVHDPGYLEVQSGLVWSYLIDKKHSGKIGHLGVSVVKGPQEALACLENIEVEMIQIPYNVLDDRWRRAEVFEKAMEQGVAIVTRSAYLQGLLSMECAEVASKLPFALPWSEQFDQLVRQIESTKVEVALRYVLSNPAIAVTLTGIDSLDQLQENMRIYGLGAYNDATLDRLCSGFPDVPEHVVNPALWPKK
jgi:aryl-alcohol dehydrogenase-like predicted oxidoreductase